MSTENRKSSINEQRSSANEQRTSINEQRTSINEQRASANEKRSLTNEQRTSANEKRSLANEPRRSKHTSTSGSKEGSKITYPRAKRDENKYVELHGHQIPDFYQYLEEDHDFLQTQTNFTNEILKSSKARDTIKRRMIEMASFQTYQIPIKVKGSYYYEGNNGINYPYIVKANSLSDSNPITLFDLNQCQEAKVTSLDNWYVSPDGKYIAISIVAQTKLRSTAAIFILQVPTGSDCGINIRNRFTFQKPQSTSSKEQRLEELLLLDKIKTESSNYIINMLHSLEPSVKVAWFHSKGFYYSSKSAIYYHKINEIQNTDICIVNYDKDIIPAPVMTYDNRYLFISCRSYNHGGNILYFAKPRSTKHKVYQMVDEWDRMYKYITNDEHFVYLLTSKKASTNRIVRIDMHNRKPRCHCEWEEIISREKNDLLVDAICVGCDYLILQYMRDGLAFLRIHSLVTGLTTHQIEHNVGDLTLGNLMDHTDKEFFYIFESVYIPPIVYYGDINECVNNNKPPDILFLNVPKNYNINDYVVDFVSFPSHDDHVHVPMYIVHERDVQSPKTTMLKVEGGFGRFFWLKYNTCTLAFIKIFGGQIAIVFVRGGGERGRKWANSGKRLNKERAVKDYQAAAEFLISHNYTTRNKLIAEGCDNGGLIVTACMVQNPNLFGAVIPILPITDMVRFTIGPHAGFLIEEYGDVHNEKEVLENVLKYSPLHHVIVEKSGDTLVEYPPLLIYTITTSPVIQSWHATKFTAALQYLAQKNSSQKNLILLKKVNLTKFNIRSFIKMLDFYTDEFTFINDYSKTVLKIDN